MSNSEIPRGLLSGRSKVPFPNEGPPEVPPQAEAALLSVQPSVQQDVQQVVLQRVPTQLQPRKVMVSLNMRVPLQLAERLREASQNYRVTMTDIVVEALERHLETFPRV